MSRCADCPYCGKSEADECSACGGVNARRGADKKRRAREQSERDGAGVSPAPSLIERADGGKPGPGDREIQPGAE